MQDLSARVKILLRYWSKTLNAVKLNYNTTHHECLAEIWGIHFLTPYIGGQRFTICTYNDAFEGILNLADLTGQLARWKLRYSKFCFEILQRVRIKSKLRTQYHDLKQMEPENTTR